MYHSLNKIYHLLKVLHAKNYSIKSYINCKRKIEFAQISNNKTILLDKDTIYHDRRPSRNKILNNLIHLYLPSNRHQKFLNTSIIYTHKHISNLFYSFTPNRSQQIQKYEDSQRTTSFRSTAVYKLYKSTLEFKST